MKALDRLAVRTERRVRHAEEEAAAVPRQARDLREAEAEDEEERAPSAEEARALLDKIARVKASFAALAEMLAPLAKADSRRGFVAALLTVLSELGVGESVVREGMGRPPRQARDLRQGAAELRAWNALVDALETLGDVDDLMAGGEIEAGAFAAEARAVIGGLRTKPSGRGEGRVVALGVHDALQSSYDYVFILGLTEGSFPLRAASDPLLPDDRRKALEAGGLAVRPRKAGQDDEAYLFHLALTRARRALYLCYPDTDAAGGELLRSYYVNEAARLLPGVDEAPVALMMRLRDVVPPLDQAAGARELAERALMLKYGVPRQARDLRGDHPDKGQEGAALQMLARGWDAETLHAAEHGAQVELVRAGRPPARFGPYDGVLARPDVIEELKRRFGPQHFWSASQLGSYGACPMGFLFERVLGIEELEEPEHEVKLMEQGLLLHRILTRFYRERVKAGLGHVAGDEGLDAAAKMLREAEEDGFAWYERGGLTGNEALWAVTKDVVRARLTAWLEAEALIPDKLKAGVLEPALFEHAYGDDEATALVLDLEVAGKAMVRGRIDRLDLVGEGGFVVFDYKRGGAPGKQATEDGADFQLAFYAMVGERLACPGRRCAAWAYIRVGMPVDKALEGKVVGEGETEGLMKLAEANAESHILMMRGGYFPWPAKCGGARFCAFSHICRWEPRRGRIRQRAEHDPSTGSGAHPDG